MSVHARCQPGRAGLFWPRTKVVVPAEARASFSSFHLWSLTAPPPPASRRVPPAENRSRARFVRVSNAQRLLSRPGFRWILGTRPGSWDTGTDMFADRAAGSPPACPHESRVGAHIILHCFFLRAHIILHCFFLRMETRVGPPPAAQILSILTSSASSFLQIVCVASKEASPSPPEQQGKPCSIPLTYQALAA